MLFFVKKPKPKPIMKMITQGRRSLGESWQEVTVAVEDDQIKVIENRPTQAPPDGKPIYVPAMGSLEMPAVDFLLEGARKSQEYGKKHPRQMSLAEFEVWLNAQWQDFAEQKLKWVKGQTTIGPAGINQRETPGRTEWQGGGRR
jgi:hypothetical protein